jgi:hypothetical protein
MILAVQQLLPVCVECGRVRTGEGRWETPIAFLKEHSHILSHGVCPDCAPAFRERLRGPRPGDDTGAPRN